MSRQVPALPFYSDYYTDEMIPSLYYDYYQYEAKPFTSFEGLHTGVPTRTTPTLTPTTLRNIEQTFIELQRDPTERGEPRHNEAGFVPPVIEPISQGGTTFSIVNGKSWIGGDTTITPVTTQMANRPNILNSSVMPVAMPSRRNVGGRRPNKNTGISAEEEERRKVRRERNKLAAARCRKRRMDHTNELLQETEGLERKKLELQNEIQSLQLEKDNLEFVLEAHRSTCRIDAAPPSPPDIKPPIFYEEDDKVSIHCEPKFSDAVIAPTTEPIHKRPQPQVGATANKPSRPSSLPVTSFTPHKRLNDFVVPGVTISTPSAGSFNFDSLMEGGTGLTPVGSTGLTPMIPSCSSQQRNGVDLASPDPIFPGKLVSL